MYTTTIDMRSKPQWKSDQQFINEHLYCDGLPYRQNDLTDLHYGMKYIGLEPAPVVKRLDEGSITVTWYGVPAEARPLPSAKRPVVTKKEDFLW